MIKFATIAVLLTINLVYVHGQCNLSQLMGTYLHCLKGVLDENYSNFEEEVQSHTRRSVESCFSQTIADANLHEKCVLATSDLNAKAWDRNGPLRDCSICRTFATTAIKAVLSTPAEDQKCIRTEITKAITAEAQTCLRTKIPNFPGLSDIPDFEEGAYAIRENVINSISDHIIINSRLAFCAERKPERAASTRQCLKSPFPGYYQQHCASLAKCDQLAHSCQATLQTTKEATCACIDEARDELKGRIARIADVIRNAVSGRSTISFDGSGSAKITACVENIKELLRTPSNDWTKVIDSALVTCIKNKPTGQAFGIDPLLNVGCRKILADPSGSATAQIKTGFDFVNNLIDAMVERSRRFCGGAHCN